MSEESGGGESSAPASEASADISTSTGNAQAGEQNSAAGIEQALEDGDITPQEAQKLMKKFSLKVRGQTKEIDVDLSDDNFLKNQFQLAETSKIAMQESAELKRAYQKEMERFKAKPWEVLKELGFDPDELAQSRIEQRIEEMKKSPEQLEQEQLREELKQAREEAKQIREEKERLEAGKLKEQTLVQINDEISSAISKYAKLPNTKYVQQKVAQQLVWAMNNGYEDATAEDVMDVVEQEMRQEMSEIYDQMPEEALEAFIGKKNIDRMRKRRVAAAKIPSANDIKQTALSNKASESARQSQSAQPKAAKDFFKSIGKYKP